MNSYTPTVWKDAPSIDTPVKATNLNKIENQLVTLTNAGIATEAALDGHKIVVMTKAEHDALQTPLPAGTLCFCYEDQT